MTQDTNPTEAPAPSMAKACPNCGDQVAPGGRGMGRTFCDADCRQAHNARTKARGAVIAPLAMAWMLTRHAKPGTTEWLTCKDARREVTAMCKIFNEEDAAAGRPPADEYARTLLRPIDSNSMDEDGQPLPYEERSPSMYADRRRG